MTTGITPGRATSAKNHASKRQRRRSRKMHRGPKPPAASRRVQGARRQTSREDAEELAYFRCFPFSTYPGLTRPHRHLRRSPAERELRRIWLRSFERWQRVRERFLRFHGRSVDDRILIKGTSFFYRDMRFWECRRCGFNAADSKTWRWWLSLDLVQRMAFVDASRQKGMYFNQRQGWQQRRGRAAA